MNMTIGKTKENGYCLTMSTTEQVHFLLFSSFGLLIEYTGSLGDLKRKEQLHPFAQDEEFNNRIRDVVASVGVELMRQKLTGEPA